MILQKILNSFFVFFWLLIICNTVNAQQPPARDTSSKKQIFIINSERLNYQKKDSVTEFQSAVGSVIIRQENTLFYCDSVVLNKTQNVLEAFGHVHINDADSVHTYSDYLKYTGNDKKAYLRDNVKLTDGKAVLTTNELVYDLNTKIGIYTNGGKVVNNKTVLTSKEGHYYGETRDVYFKKNVLLVDTGYTVKTDTLLYNTYSDIATFIVPTEITSGAHRKVLTKDGYYDLKNKKAYFGKRPEIQDSTTFLIADKVASDDSTGFGEASGNVIYEDTAQHVVIYADNLKSNKKAGSFLATEKPVMMIKQEEDSIYIAADTLYSAKLSDLRKYRTVPAISDSVHVQDTVQNDEDSTNRFFEAYYHVRIFSDSLQAVCDSLFYSGEDSVFRLFRSPVVWTQENQITGDTIYLYTLNKKPKRLYVFENALLINKVGRNYFNQVKGRTINGYFKNGNIDSMRAKGNSESIYYAQDDYNKYIGVNRATADVIDMYFENRKPQKVVFRVSLVGTTFPMRQVNHNDMKLRGFKWQEDLRPKTKDELLGKSGSIETAIPLPDH